MSILETAISHLRGARDMPERREEFIRKFQELVWNSESLNAEPQVDELLGDLAYDLDYFTRASDRPEPPFYGDEECGSRLDAALKKLADLLAAG